jgi:hypothetical protein
MTRSPREAAEVTRGGAGQGGCGRDSLVWPVADDGVEWKMGGGVPRQRRRMVTSGGCGGLQQCGEGQGGVGAFGVELLTRGREARRGEGEKGGGSHGSSVEV